ncbi:mitochondrial import receptor subunit TOM20 homolog [Mustela lutreola]|uniref:mitochondrial import receptor subunit TOM20 homolog n=1 Tax=Mustela lutreola TaxID=9666 RepID=UPI0027971EC0|nr:mitochondrial import receptor subunit TOM20 homolog [Mustela lutreola]XP_058999988.1 mitochondrial import receptor subunit TOM20 homolog [Mustela lutreola]XP_058999990.1 mitochondrial import receptor subunit TOM20 homolog [Mustela lutreola]XP_058999997.1 mitochondrial import receptor subunit TOM20 homolog [Mustela lutreola]XP_059000000.1 mitochondrial import receptor subunit TOM20 homolog [Mustela lutreola]
MLVLAKSELEIQQQKEKHLAVTLSVVIVQIFDERINKPEIKGKMKQRLRDFFVQPPINHWLTAKAPEQRLQCPHNKERTLPNNHLKHREQLSASPAASGRSQRRGRGFPAHSFFAGPAAAALAPASGPWEGGGRNRAGAAGVCGALCSGYCICFGRKRPSDPNFENRLRERRKKQKLAKERAGLCKLPDLKDAQAVQRFFLEEIQLGEELLAQGEYEKGVDHLTNAVAVCGQPQQLLQVLQQTLPPPVFQMLLTKLPTISQRIVSAQSLAEDDVE